MVKLKDNPDDEDKLQAVKNATLMCAEKDLDTHGGVLTKIIHWDKEKNSVCLTLMQHLTSAVGRDIDKLSGNELFEIIEQFLRGLRNDKLIYVMSSAASLEKESGVIDEGLALQSFDGIKIKHWVCKIIRDGENWKFDDDINQINPDNIAVNPETFNADDNEKGDK